MHPRTLLGVLLLRRAAIVDAFNSRWSLLVGGLLVLSAGLARNYDGEDLLAEPWWLAAPFGASVLTSLILWGLFGPWAKLSEGRLWRLYPRFLGLYWLTAPLAWLYAIPYERFLSPVDAIRANAYTLLAVSLWRVLIISRALSLLFSIRFRAALAFTLAFGSLVMLGATFFGPRPVLDVMGGLRLPPEVIARTNLTLATGFYAIIGIIVFGICAAVYSPLKRGMSQSSATPPTPLNDRPQRAPMGALAIAAACVLAWVPALFIAQPEQRNRNEAESVYAKRDYPALLRVLSSHTITDYPSGWKIPGSHLPARSRLGLMSELLPHIDHGTAAWVKSGYLQMARESLANFSPFIPSGDWVDDVIEDARRYPDPNHTALQRDVLGWLLHNDPSITPQQRDRINAFLSPPPAPSPEPNAPHP